MPTNIVPVNFQAPVDPIGMQVQQQQLAQNQAIAQQLREMSLTTPQVPNGSRMSWTQGAAQLAQALAAKHLTRDNQAQAYELGLQQTNADRALSNLPPLPAGTNPYSTSETGRNFLQRVGDVVRGGPPVDPQAIAAALRARVAGINGQPSPQSQSAQSGPASSGSSVPAPASGPSSPGPAGTVPSATSGITGNGGSPQPTDQVSNVPPSQVNSDPDAAPLPGSDPTRMADIGKLVQAMQSRQSSTPSAQTTPQAIGNALAVQNGMQPTPQTTPQPSPASGAPSMPMSAMPPQQQPQPPQGMPQAMPQAGGAQMPTPDMAQPGAPQGMPAQAPQPQTAPQVPMDPNIPGMTAQEGYRLRLTQPQAYQAAVTAIHTPTDLQKNLLAEGIQPGTAPWNAAVAAQVRHDATLQMRPGGTDRYGDQFTYNPVLPQGVNPQRDANGNVTGVTSIPGVTQAITEQAGASAAGPAKYDVTTTYNNQTHQPELRSRYDVATSPTPVPSAAPLGAGAGADTNAKLSQASYDADAKAGQSIPIAQQTISKLQDLSKVTLTGPGAGRMGELKGGINYALQSAGHKPFFDQDNVAHIQEMGKLAEQLAQQTAGAMGGASGATDAKLASAIRSLPNPEKAPQAMKDILDLSAQRLAIAKAFTLASAANQTRGQPANQFKANWLANNDPRIFEWMTQGTVAQNMAALKHNNPADYNALAHKSQALADMGAFGQ